ncbi:ABC transporter permease [Sansalvadorimonas sp. 2012CJ34-2]|uniref:ABC transporter permease n=1 Tax=Parendozoicomonas callyspongiae TaxID=2942213 RepID=A0ABT0PJ22_9GAMM|nr:ABC transporter permease [Sansalvadorimonas sp. 2012CJ34-2]MCL6271328.1 ABC transporter permease [Sansalvadorimonas sp. 2012CJ34-2]
MLTLIARRTLLALAMILAASALTFALIAAAPGNVAALIAERTAGPSASAELVQSIADDLGLNDPLPVRYGRWLSDSVAGDFGGSLRTGKPILEEFAERAPVTGLLLVCGGAIALIMSLTIGMLGAISNGGKIDSLLRALSLAGASTPNFFVAALLVMLFSVTLGWLPAFAGSSAASWIMPCLTIALFPCSVLSRVVRVNLQEIMSRPFATTGFAMGYTRLGVLTREALPNIAVPYLTTFGAQFTLMIIGSIVVETVFAMKGIGAFFIEAIRFRDFISMQATLLSFIMFFVFVNLFVDIICLLIDPRIRRQSNA